MSMKLYFVGEYGYVFRQLLPFLETCTEPVDLITWDSACSIINLLWPSRYVLTAAETLLDPSVYHLRDCTHLRDVPSVQKLEAMGYRHVFSVDPNHHRFHDDTHLVFGVLRKKLMYGEQRDVKPYVSVFPRLRHIQTGKNNIAQEHLDWLRRTYPGREIVGHGVAGERADLGIRYCKNIYEQICVLNNSEVFVTPSSGLADLALICGCDIVLTGDYPSIEKTNPHGCSIRYWQDVK